MAAYLPIRNLARLARLLGLGIILTALLATPVECLCGDPYPSAHALLEFILAPRTIITNDHEMPGMAMREQMNRHQESKLSVPASSSVVTDSKSDSPSLDGGMSPTIRDDVGHLERAGSYSAIGGLIFFALFALIRRSGDDPFAIWRGIRPRPATPPPRILLFAS